MCICIFVDVFCFCYFGTVEWWAGKSYYYNSFDFYKRIECHYFEFDYLYCVSVCRGFFRGSYCVWMGRKLWITVSVYRKLWPSFWQLDSRQLHSNTTLPDNNVSINKNVIKLLELHFGAWGILYFKNVK